MAIALRGTPTTATQGGGIQTISLTLPAGIVTNDVIYVFAQVSGTTLTCSTKTFTQLKTTGVTPNGWSGVLIRRISDGTEGASLTFDSGTGNQLLNIECRAYSGSAAPAAPEDSGGYSVNVGNTGTTANVAGITIAQGNAEAVFFCFTPDVGITFGTPTNYGNSIQNSGNGETIAGFDRATTGATGTVSSSGLTAGNNWGALLFAIDPGVVGAGFRRPYLPKYRQHHWHQFATPHRVRIYHPKPAQYETLLVPVKPRPVPFRTRIHWKQPKLRLHGRYRRLGAQILARAVIRHYRPYGKLPRLSLRKRLRLKTAAVLLAGAVVRPRYRSNRSMSRWHRAQRLARRLGSLQQILAARTRAMQHSRSHLPVSSRWRQVKVRVKRIGQIISVQVGQLFNNPLIKSLGKMMNRH